MFPEGNIKVEGKQNSPFTTGQVIKCFVILPSSKVEKTAKTERQLAYKFFAVSRSTTLSRASGSSSCSVFP